SKGTFMYTPAFPCFLYIMTKQLPIIHFNHEVHEEHEERNGFKFSFNFVVLRALRGDLTGFKKP
ncbi:hypothetical protein ACFL9U_00005, partial [Thermodesulfobacteriota bacterium]